MPLTKVLEAIEETTLTLSQLRRIGTDEMNRLIDAFQTIEEINGLFSSGRILTPAQIMEAEKPVAQTRAVGRAAATSGPFREAQNGRNVSLTCTACGKVCGGKAGLSSHMRGAHGAKKLSDVVDDDDREVEADGDTDIVTIPRSHAPHSGSVRRGRPPGKPSGAVVHHPDAAMKLPASINRHW